LLLNDFVINCLSLSQNDSNLFLTFIDQRAKILHFLQKFNFLDLLDFHLPGISVTLLLLQQEALNIIEQVLIEISS